MPTIPELRQQVAQERSELKTYWESFPEKQLADGSKARDIPADKLTEFNSRSDALDKLVKDLATLQAAEALVTGAGEPVNRPGLKAGGDLDGKSVSEQVLESAQYKRRDADSLKMGTVNVKADLFGLARKAVMGAGSGFGSGFQAESTRDGDIVPYLNTGKPKVILAVPTELTENETITYVRQTSRTSGAEAKTEGQVLGSSDWVLATVTDPLRTVGHVVDVTLQQLNDVPQARHLLDVELPAMVLERLEAQYLVGSGAGSNLTGVYNDANIQSQARGSLTNADAVLKAVVKVEAYSDDQSPDICVLTPLAWQNIMLEKTADGIYLYGGPQGRMLESLWGVRVIKSQNLTATTGLVFDSRYFPLVYRQGMQVDFTNSDGEKFDNLISTARAFVRAGVKHRRGQAACKITSVNES